MLIRGKNMELCYNNFGKILIDKKMKRNKSVSSAIILKICEALNCNINVVTIESSNQRGA